MKTRRPPAQGRRTPTRKQIEAALHDLDRPFVATGRAVRSRST